GIFHLESQGMRRALLDMRPDRFEDIIALVALYRPGPMANIPTYCARKHLMEEPDYIHPKLEPILRETFGVIVYQEQVMQAAQILAGYSLGEADLLRRAMGKKIRSEMQKQRSRFVSGCVEWGLERGQAEAIFELLARFADYGFNKIHAAAYSLVAYQTAFMNANYPVEFLAASMTLDMGNTDKLSEFRVEAERLGVKVESPSVNRSGVDFEVEGSTVHYALAALKGVGRQAVEAIIQARGERPFADLSDFAARIKPHAVNKRVLESLAAAGAFDSLEPNRARVFGAADAILATAQRAHDDIAVGQSELFVGAAAPAPLALRPIGPSDPTRHHEAVVFSEGLAQFRDLLEPGAAVLLMLSAELQGDDVRARIQMVEPLDQAAAKLARGLRVFLRDQAPIESVAKRLEGPQGAAKDNGEVELVLMLGTET